MKSPVTDTDTSLLTLDEAFAKAKEEHSTPDKDDEQAPPDEDSTLDDKEDDAPETEGETAKPDPDDTAADETETTDLISDAEYDALSTKYADDPKKLRLELNKVFTQKTQKLAADRKLYERTKPIAGLVDALDENPEAAVRALAALHGVDLSPKAKGTEDVKTPTDDERAAAATETLMAQFKADLGPDLEYLAEGIAPAVKRYVESLTAATVDRVVKPMKDQQQVILDRASQESTDAVMKAFTEQRPDWKQHEAEMFALSQKLSPKGMTELEFLTLLHDQVTRPLTAKAAEAATKAAKDEQEKEIAKRVQLAVNKLNKGAEESDTPQRSTPEKQVRIKRPDNATFDDAAEAARRGEVWAD